MAHSFAVLPFLDLDTARPDFEVARIDGELIDFVVDRNVHKHGKLMPGVHIPHFTGARSG